MGIRKTKHHLSGPIDGVVLLKTLFQQSRCMGRARTRAKVIQCMNFPGCTHQHFDCRSNACSDSGMVGSLFPYHSGGSSQNRPDIFKKCFAHVKNRRESPMGEIHFISLVPQGTWVVENNGPLCRDAQRHRSRPPLQSLRSLQYRVLPLPNFRLAAE